MAVPSTWYRKRVDELRSMSSRSREELRSFAETLQFPRRALIFTPGAQAAVHVVESGRIRLSGFAEDGTETVWAILEPGEMFADAGPGADGVRTTMAEALEDTVVLRFDRAAQARMHESASDAARWFCEFVVEASAH